MSDATETQKKVGGTSLTLPALGFGAAHLGELYAKVDESASRATLEAAWAAGLRFYDTAPWYGRGLSEHRLGGFLRTMPRSEFKITTKVGRQLTRPKDPAHFDRSPWLGGLNFEVLFDYSYDGIMRSYAQALQRLALDTVDALIIHDLDVGFHGDAQAGYEKQLVDSGMKALEELKRSGDIQAYGMGVNMDISLETTARRVDLDFCLVAMPYTLLDQRSLHGGMADLTRRGVSVIVGAPLASGILATGSGGEAHYGYAKAPADVQAKVRAMEEVCEAHGVALPAAALQFVLAHPAVVSAIPGAMKPSEVTANARHVVAPIPSGFWSDLKARNLIDPDAPVPVDRS